MPGEVSTGTGLTDSFQGTSAVDVGRSGQALVQRDLQRCRRVLVALGQDLEEA